MKVAVAYFQAENITTKIKQWDLSVPIYFSVHIFLVLVTIQWLVNTKNYI